MSDLLVERRGAILQITFNRPDKKNAVTPEIVVRLAEAWKRLRDDAELRVAILTGVGDAFCAGLLSGLLDGYSLPEAVRRGAALGAFCVSTFGDYHGLPDRAALETFIAGKHSPGR